LLLLLLLLPHDGLFSLDLLLSFEVVSLELGELRVVLDILDVEGEGEVVEYVLAESVVVVLEVHVESLLVVHVEVVLDLVVQLELEQSAAGVTLALPHCLVPAHSPTHRFLRPHLRDLLLLIRSVLRRGD
jgi:hypothetical protein